MKPGFFLFLGKHSFEFSYSGLGKIRVVFDIASDDFNVGITVGIDVVVDPWLSEGCKSEPIATRIVNKSPKGGYIFVSRWRLIKPRNVAFPPLKLFGGHLVGKDIKLIAVLKSPLDRYAYGIAELAQNQARIEPFFKEGYNDLPHPLLEVCGYNTPLYEAF